jgi:nicotinate-nucleotide--dimethylbenzimidazole phosphoribosyltransferase
VPKFSVPSDVTGRPLDDTRALLRQLPSFDGAAAARAQGREDGLYHAPRERGRLGSLPVWLSGWRATPEVAIAKIELCLFAGAHGWLSDASRTFAHKELKTRLLLLSSGGSAANVHAGFLRAGLRVFDLAIDRPSADATTHDAITELECAQAIGFGLEAVQNTPDVLILHGLGVGGREVAAALALCLFGGQAADWLAGATTDLSDGYQQAELAVQRMVAVSSRSAADPLERLRRLGSREIAAAIGAILAARLQKIPVILDGFEATVAGAVLAALSPGAIDHCLAAGRDGTASHDRLLSLLRLEPLMDLGIQGGDGLAGLLAAEQLRTAMTLHLGLATREQMLSLLSDEVSATH